MQKFIKIFARSSNQHCNILELISLTIAQTKWEYDNVISLLETIRVDIFLDTKNTITIIACVTMATSEHHY